MAVERTHDRQAGPPVLQVKGMSVGWRRSRSRHDVVKIVDDVSLTVQTGEALGLVGESGSGKSVTARAIMGLLPAGLERMSGTVHVDGEELHVGSRSLRQGPGRRLAFVAQNPMQSLNPTMRVGRQIEEALGIAQPELVRAHRSAQAVDLLRRVGIEDPERRSHEFPHALSGGMKQRVAISIALARSPDVLIADEPTTALDATVQKEILDLLRSLVKERGMSLVLIAHDLAVVAAVCQRLAVMYAGQIAEVGDLGRILRSPGHPYTEGLLRSLPEAVSDVSQLAPMTGGVPDPREWPDGCRFVPRCPYAVERCTPDPIVLREVATGWQARCCRTEELNLQGIANE